MSQPFKIIVGCDPGLYGGLCVLSCTPPVEKRVYSIPAGKTTAFLARGRAAVETIYSMPTKPGRLLDANKVVENLKLAKAGLKQGERALFAIEQVTAMRGEGVVSTFSFAWQTGFLIGAARALDFDIWQVRPAVWKAHFGLVGVDKKASVTLANDLMDKMGGAPIELEPHQDGEAESFLIAFGAAKLHNKVSA